MAEHPNNAPATGFPDLRGRTIDRVAADILCAGTGLPGIPVNAPCPSAVPIADNEISFRVPRTNERRPDPRDTTNLLMSNDAESWYHGLQAEWTRRFAQGCGSGRERAECASALCVPGGRTRCIRVRRAESEGPDSDPVS